MRRLLEGIRAFQEGSPPFDTAGIARGQDPEALLICCSDSRVVPHLVTQSGPGQIFVIRNAGNLLSSPGGGSAEEATIEYGVRVLRIPHLIVCGHTHCGAMQAIVDGVDSLPAVSRWLVGGDETRRRAGQRCPEGDHLQAVIEENVLIQLERARQYPAVREAEAAGALTLHGWVYDIETARFTAWDASTKCFRPVIDDERRAA